MLPTVDGILSPLPLGFLSPCQLGLLNPDLQMGLPDSVSELDHVFQPLNGNRLIPGTQGNYTSEVKN